MHDHDNVTSPRRPLIFGEVLFDHLPDGRAVLGGAPFNVAWHLQGLGLRPLLISCIGEDAAGEQVLAAMQSWGMDASGMQRDRAHPTGTVQIALEQGQPGFHILPDQAYDYIDADAALASAGREPRLLLYHGTLAARSETSRRALEALRSFGTPVFVDVNLRSPWWEPGRVRHLVRGARWLKLSREEFDVLTRDCPDDRGGPCSPPALRARYGLELLVITDGAAGARVFTPFSECGQAAVPAEPLADTVGAGDAFAAVCILGISRGWALADTLARAATLAARVCSVPGAILPDRRLYQDLLERWSA